MKMRNGFVSNSSSSSFILAIKGPKNRLKSVLKESFAVPKGHPFEGIIQSITECFLEEVERAEVVDHEWIVDRYDWDPDHEEAKWLHKLLADGYKVFEGSFTDEDEAAEAMLCDMDLDIKTDNIIIKKEGGY